ncbi:hypothetical protein TWF694_006787 [Orbilia ellipsospora]|uniref:DUF5672 domain-containing protein n=1 Tax=Orbilia ellipsospora TaxID=2528407 RepID=A0AAV9XLL3_9PEZI
MKITIDFTEVATQYQSVNPRNRKFFFLLPISLALVWFMWIFGPSHESVKSALPKVSVNYHPNRPPPSPYNETKLALLIETRPLGHLAPLLLHMITIVPPEWRFMVLGSEESIAHLNSSLPVQMHERNGKLDLHYLPANASVATTESISQLFTNLWFYEDVIGGKRGVENLLVFQSDSILCANSELSINDWLEYDWVGAPWSLNDKFGGNGGLSLRKISKIRQVLLFQERIPETETEDQWLIKRIGLLPGANMANARKESEFSVESVWHQSPMGYHLTLKADELPTGVWANQDRRKQIYDYCPEIKMIMKMRLERERCSQSEIDNWRAAHPNEKRDIITEGSLFPVPFGSMGSRS